MRLGEVGERYGERVRIHWRAFPLVPDHRPGRRTTERTQESRRRARLEEPRALHVPPPIDSPLPASSIPALTAVKCAERQGEQAFARLHARLFLAHFRDNLDISRQDVLWRLAEESALDLSDFERDYRAGQAYEAVLRDYADGAAWFGVSAIPAVVFGEKVSLVGAVPVDRYAALIEWIAAGAPGGVVPLDSATPHSSFSIATTSTHLPSS